MPQIAAHDRCARGHTAKPCGIRRFFRRQQRCSTAARQPISEPSRHLRCNQTGARRSPRAPREMRVARLPRTPPVRDSRRARPPCTCGSSSQQIGRIATENERRDHSSSAQTSRWTCAARTARDPASDRVWTNRRRWSERDDRHTRAAQNDCNRLLLGSLSSVVRGRIFTMPSASFSRVLHESNDSFSSFGWQL